MNGIWIRGATQTGNTFTRFASIQGTPPVGVVDLTTQPGVLFTVLTDSGAGSTGTNTGTTPYNNAAGNSYQFLARAGATGTEQLGAVLFAAPNQCVLPALGIVAPVANSDVFKLTASSACNGDDFDVGGYFIGTLATHTITITIESDPADTTVLVLAQSQLNLDVGVGVEVYHKNVNLPPGAYHVIGIVTVILTAVQSSIDTASVTVGAGACGNTVVDVLAVNSHTDTVIEQLETEVNQNFTRIEARGNTTCQKASDADCEGIKADLVPISAQVNETELHADELVAQAVAGRADNNATRVQVDETEAHTDDLLAQQVAQRSADNATRVVVDDIEVHSDNAEASLIGIWARLNTTCQKTIIFGPDCEGIGTLVKNKANITINATQDTGLFGMTALPGLSNSVTTAIIIFLALLILSAYNGWWMTMVASLIGVIQPIFVGGLPIGFKGCFFLLILGVCFDLMLDFRAKRSANKAMSDGAAPSELEGG
jgi:hypothetical protein